MKFVTMDSVLCSMHMHKSSNIMRSLVPHLSRTIFLDKSIRWRDPRGAGRHDASRDPHVVADGRQLPVPVRDLLQGGRSDALQTGRHGPLLRGTGLCADSRALVPLWFDGGKRRVPCSSEKFRDYQVRGGRRN